jgi:hypothetical protein
MSFIKEPVYPLFVAACYRLGLPLRLVTEGLYLAAAGFLAYSLVLYQSRPIVGLLVFAACALHPAHLIVFQHPVYDTIYTCLIMVALGAVLLQFKRGDEPGRWRRRLGTGLALALLYNTRPERPWVLLLLIAFVIAAAVRVWRRYLAVGARCRKWAAEWVLPVAVVAALTVAIMTANFARWGIFATTDQEAPGFIAAKRALMSIQPKHPVRGCSVTREMRELAYGVSPRFRELRRFLEGDLGEAWSAGPKQDFDLPRGEMGDWFWWALRDASVLAGHCTSARDSEAFYYRIADEINTAAAAGRVPTRFVLTVSLDPCLDNWLPFVFPCFLDAWSNCWANWQSTYPPPIESLDTRVIQIYNAVSCRRSILKGPTAQSQIRTWLWQTYERIMDGALAGAGLILVAVVLLRRSAPGWGAYLLTAGALGFIGFTRIGFLTLAWASNLTPAVTRYLLPAALMLYIMAVWLLAEGVRLLGCAVVRSFQTARGRAPVIRDAQTIGAARP